MEKPILLAPAGDYETFLAAVDAGADAVYLAGPRFGARAYAGNFTEEEIIRAIRHAHMFGRQIHLTLNTLIKQGELADIIPFLTPLVEAGLDAVILQDMGAVSLIHNAFPELSIHASTQMTVTGPRGAKMLSDMGFSCVICARECSLSDMEKICKSTECDVEVFVHGAMCYSYSGQCLFSSMLGERSANRGRCAGPCRMEYEAAGERGYLLSLADLCAIRELPNMMRAGVNSFKIEGRMKPVDYVRSITSIYRKYIDFILENPDRTPVIEKEDIRILEGIYHRGGIEAGYLKGPRSHHRVTKKSPAYRAADENLINKARSLYGNAKAKIPINMEISLRTGSPIALFLSTENESVYLEGPVAEAAKNAGLTMESVKKQLGKLGNTVFLAEDIKVLLDEGCFVPLKEINELRRKGCEDLSEKILSGYKNG